jgi:MFS family permease
VIGIGGIIGRLAMGAISDKIGRGMTLSICLALVGASILWLLVANKVWMFYLFSVVFGFFYGGATPSLPALCGELFGLKSLGLIYGTLLLVCTISAAISAPLAGHMFDITGSYQLAFLIGGLAALLGAVIAFLFLKAPKPGHLG